MKVQIVDRNPDGRGRGQAGARTVLVSQAHPGEEVVVRIDRKTRGTVQGRVASLVVADPDRLVDPCPHEFHCTGCALLAVSREEERAFKLGRLEGVFDQFADDVDIEPVRIPTEPFGYRCYAKQIFTGSPRGLVLGSYVMGTHRVVDNVGCPVLHPQLVRLMATVAEVANALDLDIEREDRPGLRGAIARHSLSTGRQLLILTGSCETAVARTLADAVVERLASVSGVWLLGGEEPSNNVLAGEPELLRGEPTLTESLLGFEHEIGPTSFFQINPAGAEEVFKLACTMAGEGGRCIEGYAGVGALTLPLSERFERVVAIESHSQACASLEKAAHRYDRAGRIDVRSGSVDEVLPTVLGAAAVDAAVLDPPRKGLGQPVADLLAQRGPDRLVLVSCGPEALGRDLPVLLRGGYGITRVVPVDQFPRTAHVETVVRLDRSGGG